MKKSSWHYEIIANINDFEMIDRCTIFAAVLYTIINHDDSHTEILRRDASMEAGQRSVSALLIKSARRVGKTALAIGWIKGRMIRPSFLQGGQKEG